uniref:TBC1 domain family member 30 n=1 Tax=Clastoptera arizonana TaxID=38151 RepID=A0A1B6DM75_9HEMI
MVYKMLIKEKLPWTIDSPSIHLIQPSERVPLVHEVVSRQPSVSEDDIILFTLSNQEWKIPKPLKKQEVSCLKDNKEREEYTLMCDYISPTLQWQLQPRRSSSFDLRVGQNSSKENVKNSKILFNNGAVNVQEDKQKHVTDFNDIVKELQMDVSSRKNSDTECCVTSSPIVKNIEPIGKNTTRSNSVEETDSIDVFYDVHLNDEETVKLPARKSFSEQTFEQNRKLALIEKRNMSRNSNHRMRTVSSDSCDDWCEEMWQRIHPRDTRRVSQMVDELLLEIYGSKECALARRRSCIGRLRHSSVKEEESSEWDVAFSVQWRRKMLEKKGIGELHELLKSLQTEIRRFGSRLVRHLKRRDCFTVKREMHCDWITAYLQANSEKRMEDTRTKFSISPGLGESGFNQWVNGMRMVARLPEGIPHQFRKTLWLNLAEKHLSSRGVNWQEVEEFCFNEFTNPDDEELGVQIVKDVHRTGCSLFCGASGQHNQALLKRVLLAYARWNKAVGYCQGFNMLAALILQVMDKSEVDSVKVMIFLIEGVLPESYFANNLRGLSVDMAVFRDLLRLKLPALSRHLELLQSDSKDSGTSYEPPLTNVFTMQWFLTLFCNCLPQDTVLRVWDLIFLEGNQILLCTALAIWNILSDRIMSVESADEFYCIMGVLTREMLEFGLMDVNNLIKAIVSINFSELGEMRERYLYNITPWTQSVSTAARRGLRLFYSDDDTDNEEDDEKIAIATAYGLFRSPKKKEITLSGIASPPKTIHNYGSLPDREKIAMDISALKKQYCKLRERQRQAHIILTAACGGQTLVNPTPLPAMNHLLLGKCALVNNKGRRLGPPLGSIPPPSTSYSTPGSD